MSSVSLGHGNPVGPVEVLYIFIDDYVGFNLKFLPKVHTLTTLVHRVAQLKDGRIFRRQVLVWSYSSEV